MIKDLFKPKSIDDHYDGILVKYIKDSGFGHSGHLFFHGEPGSGKTQMAHLIGHDWLGHSFGLNFHEFNASDDRGIDFIRGELKDLTKNANLVGNRKVILLDECDGLTRDAQDALRRIMETGKATFILTANFPHKLIPALKDRCVSFEFKGPSYLWLEQKAAKILDTGTYVKFMEAVKISKPSFRDIFGNFEKLVAGSSASIEKKLLELPLKDFVEYSFVNDPIVTIQKLHREILGLTHKRKAEILLELAETDFRCSQMTTKSLQLQAGYIKIRKLMKDA